MPDPEKEKQVLASALAMQKLTGYETNASTRVPRGTGAIDETQKNVLHQSLHQHSSRASYPMASSSLPPTLFKAGFCDASTPIAATLTQSFLDFPSKEGGANLKQMGVRPGQKWCVETRKWRETVNGIGDGGEVPRVTLECTHEKALEGVGVEVLRRYAERGGGRV